MSAITLQGVSKVYPDNHLAVDNFNLRIEHGELLVLLGPSGCGKTTALRVIAGLEEITAGRLWLDDRLANNMPTRERNVAMVFQTGGLYTHLTVRGNLAFPLELSNFDAEAVNAKVTMLAESLGIEDTLDRKTDTLSGGERQRVAIGRAIIRDPGVFLLDEPLASLDPALRTEFRSEISSLVHSLGVTTVYVTHDQTEALAVADRVAIMRAGLLEDVGTPEQVYHDPATAFVASFLSMPQINLVYGTVYTNPDGGVILDLGGQPLFLPPTDSRARYLVVRHNTTIIVGIRPDALRVVPEPERGTTLTGRLARLEYHGYEWLAHLEIGARPVDTDQLGNGGRRAAPAEVAARFGLKLSRNNKAVGRRHNGVAGGTRQGTALLANEGLAPRSGHRRRADLVARLRAVRGQQPDSEIHVDVDRSQLLFFDERGARIDPLRR